MLEVAGSHRNDSHPGLLGQPHGKLRVCLMGVPWREGPEVGHEEVGAMVGLHLEPQRVELAQQVVPLLLKAGPQVPAGPGKSQIGSWPAVGPGSPAMMSFGPNLRLQQSWCSRRAQLSCTASTGPTPAVKLARQARASGSHS